MMRSPFALALALRWAYAIPIYASMGNAGLMGVDSTTYVAHACTFTDPFIMPLYNLALCAPITIGGPLLYILCQGVVDSLTCELVERMRQGAGFIAAFNPTMIVLSGLIYPETLFTFFIILALQPQAGRAGLALATLVRVSVAPWALALCALRRQWLALCAVALALTTISTFNYARFDTFALTPQSGPHLALWIVPLAREAQDRTPYAESLAQMVDPDPSPDPFIQSQRYLSTGREAMREISYTSLAKAWALGIAINLASPAILLSPPVANLPHPSFYNTQGTSTWNKIWNYLSANSLYNWLIISSGMGLMIARLIQLRGLHALGLDWLSFVAFILFLNGPIASPKYRLPIEPFLCIALAAGLRR